MYKFLKKYDAEIIATVFAVGFIALCALITEQERIETLQQACIQHPSLQECETINPKKE